MPYRTCSATLLSSSSDSDEQLHKHCQHAADASDRPPSCDNPSPTVITVADAFCLPWKNQSLLPIIQQVNSLFFPLPGCNQLRAAYGIKLPRNSHCKWEPDFCSKERRRWLSLWSCHRKCGWHWSQCNQLQSQLYSQLPSLQILTHSSTGS